MKAFNPATFRTTTESPFTEFKYLVVFNEATQSLLSFVKRHLFHRPLMLSVLVLENGNRVLLSKSGKDWVIAPLNDERLSNKDIKMELDSGTKTDELFSSDAMFTDDASAVLSELRALNDPDL